ncbi:hypothetical protein U9M48_038928, partial [Paspalum notatum var. saurae]
MLVTAVLSHPKVPNPLFLTGARWDRRQSNRMSPALTYRAYKNGVGVEHEQGLQHAEGKMVAHHFTLQQAVKEACSHKCSKPTMVHYINRTNEGLYLIHVAASAGAKHDIALIVEKCGANSASLHGAKGRTFLHVAVGKRDVGIVGYACGDGSLACIMNMEDNNRNTALRLAVQDGSLRMFSALRHDIKEKYDQIHGRHTEREKKHTENVKDTAQTLCIGSVLIAMVTFGLTFALPRGYRADDHCNGGSPTLAGRGGPRTKFERALSHHNLGLPLLSGRYAFDAFVIANTLAFTLSSTATILLMCASSASFKTRNHKSYSSIDFNLVDVS